MANAFSDYEVRGAAEPRRARAAALIDLGIGAFLALMIWPFPVMRIVTTDAMGSVAFGWILHVALILVFIAIVDWLYAMVSAMLLHRTAGMYLQDIGFRDGPPDRAQAFAAAWPWTVAGVAGVFGVLGPSVRVTETRLGSTKADT